jgi:adenylate cyclase class IV
MNQVDLTDISRTFHPNTKEDIFFIAPHRDFSKTDHRISHKESLNRYEKIKITADSYQTTMGQG